MTSAIAGRVRPRTVALSSRVHHVAADGRHEAGVRVWWRPSVPSDFWSAWGVGEECIDVLLEAPDASRTTLSDILDRSGVGTTTGERDLDCHLDLIGPAAAIGDVAATLAERVHGSTYGVAPWGCSSARVARSMARAALQPDVVAARHLMATHIIGPERFQRVVGQDTDGPPVGTEQHALMGPARVVVVGSTALAERMVDLLPDEAMAPDDGTTPALVEGIVPDAYLEHPGGQCHVTLAGVVLGDLTAVVELEIALEVLAGWTGSVLVRRLRRDLGVTYTVVPRIEYGRVGSASDVVLGRWSVAMATSPGSVSTLIQELRDAPYAAVAHVRERDGSLSEAAWSAMTRLERRELLWHDSVRGSLLRCGPEAALGIPSQAAWRLDVVGGDPDGSLMRGLERVAAGAVTVLGGDLSVGR